MFAKQSEAKILSWIKTDDLNEFGRYLLSGSIHGKPGVPVSELGRIEKVIKKNLSETEQYKLAKKLLKRTEYTARNIGVHLVVSGWPEAVPPRFCESEILSRDEDSF